MSGDAVTVHVRERLAGYKAPRKVVVIDDLRRLVNGKLDYDYLRSLVV